ncbi:MAG: methenyltetrahydromethanopterin cyclohydrolase [Haloferacaceae archaeon]
MESLNRMAVELADEALEFAGELGIAVRELDSGATVLDFGVEADGGIEAGLLLAEIQTAGLATVQTRMGAVAGAPRTHVELATDRPGLACLCSQKAGWELAVDGFEGLGSGPARALVGEEAEFESMGYYDEFDLTVLTVESESLPTDAVAEHVADRAGVDPSGVFLPAYATGSLAGSVATAARAAELAVFRLFELGYDPHDVRSAAGSAPVAPASRDEATAMGRTADALAYGGRVHLHVDGDVEAVDELPSTAAAEYGTPLGEAFESADWDLHEVPASVFGPAAVTVDVVGGPTYARGERREDLLAASFGGA